MIQTTTYVKITRIHLTAGGNSKVYFKDTIFFKVDFSRFSRFSQKNAWQPVVNQPKSCSPTCHEFADFFSPENIAVWSRNQQKTVDHPISAHAHFCVFSVICWQLYQIWSYNNESGRKLKLTISSIDLQLKTFDLSLFLIRKSSVSHVCAILRDMRNAFWRFLAIIQRRKWKIWPVRSM